MFDPKDSVMDTSRSDIETLKKQLKKQTARQREELAFLNQKMLDDKTRLIVDALRGLTLKQAQSVLENVNAKIAYFTVMPLE